MIKLFQSRFTILLWLTAVIGLGLSITQLSKSINLLQFETLVLKQPKPLSKQKAQTLPAKSARAQYLKALAFKDISLLQQSLQTMPANGYGWYHLAVMHKQKLQFRQAHDAMLKSVAVMPFEPALIVQRLDYALPIWQTLPQTLQDAMRRDMHHYHGISAWRAAKLSAKYNRPEILRQFLQYDAEELAAFEKSFRYYRRLLQK